MEPLLELLRVSVGGRLSEACDVLREIDNLSGSPMPAAAEPMLLCATRRSSLGGGIVEQRRVGIVLPSLIRGRLSTLCLGYLVLLSGGSG